MTTARRVKISISLPAALVADVDRRARALPSGGRSGVIEAWLRRGARVQAESDLREAVVAYYAALSEEEASASESLSRSLSVAARKLEIDGPRAGRSGAR